MTLIQWTPVKNTERTAIAKHGDVWQLMEAPWSKDATRHLITSPDKADLRWIGSEQVVSMLSE